MCKRLGSESFCNFKIMLQRLRGHVEISLKNNMAIHILFLYNQGRFHSHMKQQNSHQNELRSTPSRFSPRVCSWTHSHFINDVPEAIFLRLLMTPFSTQDLVNLLNYLLKRRWLLTLDLTFALILSGVKNET